MKTCTRCKQPKDRDKDFDMRTKRNAAGELVLYPQPICMDCRREYSAWLRQRKRLSTSVHI